MRRSRCGTGTLAIELARRGAEVLAVDLSPTLVEHARALADAAGVAGRIRFHAGDMLDPSLGPVDVAVAMDSVIHYELPQMVGMIAALAHRAPGGVLVTVAPFTPVLGTLLAAGRLFPRRDRSPRIAPVSDRRLRAALAAAPGLAGWQVAGAARVERGFYRSQAYRLLPAGVPRVSFADQPGGVTR
jgi:magnesium-protoporphyrin O-methyltransferase